MSETARPEGGVEWELAQAEHAIIAAGTDPVALAVAFRRHAEAIRNMMQSAIVPAFVDLVDRAFGARLDPWGEKIDGLRTDVQASAQDVATRLGKHAEDIDDLALRVSALEANSARLEALEDAIASLRLASVAERDAGDG